MSGERDKGHGEIVGNGRPESASTFHVAFIVNEMSPYRAHKLRRFAVEIAGMRMTTLLTHEVATAAFQTRIPPQINLLTMGHGLRMEDQPRLSFAWAHWRNGGRIIRWLRQSHVRAVVIFGYGDPGHIRIIRWCHARRIPCLMWGDSNILKDGVRGVRAVIKRLAVGRIVGWCDALLACGRRGDAYFSRYGATPDKLFRVPNEPDYDEIASLTREQVAEIARRYGLAEGRRRIVFSGRLVALKRIDLLIDAFSKIAGERPEWDLVIAGSGELESSLRARVPKSLTDRVIWTGFIETSVAMAGVFRASDLLVLCSDWEAWGLVLNEAAAAGMAIIASSVVGAAPELVRDGVNGFIFERGDVADLTRCLLRATDSDSIDKLKTGSALVLAEWRRNADPVEGLRRAFVHTGVC